MIGGGLARRYVQPLFEVAQEKNELEKVNADLKFLDAVFVEVPQVRSFLNDPSVARRVKHGAVENLFKDASPYTLNFMKVVIDKNRTLVFDVAYRMFKEYIDAARGVTIGTVESAVEIDEDLFANISSQVERRFNRKVDLERKVTPDILGGLRIQVGNTVLDSSVMGRLSRLRETIAGA